MIKYYKIIFNNVVIQTVINNKYFNSNYNIDTSNTFIFVVTKLKIILKVLLLYNGLVEGDYVWIETEY